MAGMVSVVQNYLISFVRDGFDTFFSQILSQQVIYSSLNTANVFFWGGGGNTSVSETVSYIKTLLDLDTW